METMIINGARVKIGPKPAVLTFCGFKDRKEVEAVADKSALDGKPFMNMNDVADYFGKLY